MKASELLLGLVTVVSLGYAFIVTQKVDRVAKRLDTTVDDISRNTTIEVPESVVNEAIHVAADRAARLAVREATHDIVEGMKKDIRSEVKESVKESSEDIRTRVSKEINRQVSNIDISELRRQVVNDSKEMAVEKLNGDMDDILKNFNDELLNISKIYNSIAGSISGTKNHDNGLVFRVG